MATTARTPRSVLFMASGAMPWLAVALLVAFACATAVAIGGWPTPYDPDPKSVPGFALLRDGVLIAVLMGMLSAPVAALRAFLEGLRLPRAERSYVLLSVAGWILLLALMLSDLGRWILD